MESVKSQFFGRERILYEIVQGVLAPQPTSFSLVGSKLIGKSRLLNYLASDTGPLLQRELADWRPLAYQDSSRVLVARFDCDWPELQEDLLGHMYRHLAQRLAEVERIRINWDPVQEESNPSRQLWQICRQLNRLGYRLVLLLDNFDTVFENQLLSVETIDELRPLTLEIALVVATEQPLHDLDRDLAASPLFNVMTQLFLSLMEPEAAQKWLAAYAEHFPGIETMVPELLELTGPHPFLLGRIGDIFTEVEQMLPPGQMVDRAHLPLLRLRLAEHGRLLFETCWNKIRKPPRRLEGSAIQALLKRLLKAPLQIQEVRAEQFPALNWLINQAMVAYTNAGYRLFSPLFGEFLSARLAEHPTPAAPPAPRLETVPIYDRLTKIEAALLRYFEARPHQIIPPEQLLADIWKRPDASPRRVQEAIRRLRLQLQDASPPVGVIENERGRGYRFVPATR